MYLAVVLGLGVLLVSALTPTPTVNPRNSNGQFVTTQDGKFMFNGNRVNFIGTNVPWLAALNSDDDIDFTLGNISAANLTVVRTWAFNDVNSIPENGTWFQLISNGTTTINNGTNGLQKLDTVVRLAQKHGIFLVLSLTNNWNPTGNTTNGTSVLSARDVQTDNSLPRNYLSNDFGGMDVYVRQFENLTHDEFYTNSFIFSQFSNYTTQIVSRYVNSPAILAWEIANDPRCHSSIPSSETCSPNIITSFHANISRVIKAVDPNHLVGSGAGGFFCVDCPKLFPLTVVHRPQSSPVPTSRRSNIPKPLTRRSLLEERKATLKKKRSLRKRVTSPSEDAIRIRGNWLATQTKRQDPAQGSGSAFDGSQGVDSEDIINIPQIGFGTFQLFPDQNFYGTDQTDLNNPDLPAFNQTLDQGLHWLLQQGQIGQVFGKPMVLNGFGLVTQSNAPFFVPFNSTQAPFGSDSVNTTSQSFGVTDAQRNDAYAQWLQGGLMAGLQSMIQYQWSQANLTASVGTVVSPTVSGTVVSPTVSSLGLSPNDGYAIEGQGLPQAISTIQQGALAFGQ